VDPACGVPLARTAVTLTSVQTSTFKATVTGPALAVANDAMWSIKPSAGSISSTGVYTAPASIPVTETTGAANKEIAFRLGLTEGTIKADFVKLASKFHVGSRVEMALWAERSGEFHYTAEILT
jgi:hypothetical protein